MHENSAHIFFYQVDEKAGSVTGYTVPSGQGETAAVPVWQKLFGAHRHVTVAHNQVNIYQSARPGSVLSQKYFYLNPNLLALAVVDTEESEGEEELDLLLIDTVTGQLLHQVHHNAAQGPVNIVAKDYWVAYQYWNSKTQQHEISVIEMYYNDDRAQHTFSSYDHEDVYPDTFESQSYINPRGVRVMQPTATHYGITNTHVLRKSSFVLINVLASIESSCSALELTLSVSWLGEWSNLLTRQALLGFATSPTQ